MVKYTYHVVTAKEYGSFDNIINGDFHFAKRPSFLKAARRVLSAVPSASFDPVYTVTVAEREDDPMLGYSVASPIEQFSKKEGKIRSLARLNKAGTNDDDNPDVVGWCKGFEEALYKYLGRA
jgi:hypothetical protein